MSTMSSRDPSPLALAHFDSNPQADNNTKEHTTPFRYIIFRNSVETRGSESAERTGQVLLDDNAFSEETLRTLLRLISRRYPRPDWMTVWVLTNTVDE